MITKKTFDYLKVSINKLQRLYILIYNPEIFWISKQKRYKSGIIYNHMKNINDEDYLRIRRNIIKKLYAHNAFVKGHLLFERIRSGIHSHLQGYVKPILKLLIKEELVIVYSNTIHGKAYQLNIKKLKQIEEIIN